MALTALILVDTVANRGAINSHYHHEVERERARLQAQVEAETLNEKRVELEQLFKLTYESLRTISLFPAVRSVAGGNGTSEAEDIQAMPL